MGKTRKCMSSINSLVTPLGPRPRLASPPLGPRPQPHQASRSSDLPLVNSIRLPAETSLSLVGRPERQEFEADSIKQEVVEKDPISEHNQRFAESLNGTVSSSTGGAEANMEDANDYMSLKEQIPDLGITEEQLVNMPTKELNRMLKKAGITKNRMQEIKEKRRTLKNRGYAASCRHKREGKESELELEIAELKRRSELMQQEKNQIELWILDLKKQEALLGINDDDCAGEEM